MEHGTSGPDVQRLLEAWRGEVEAGAVYHALAERERDPRRAAVIARMAEVEDGHRQRLEARLRELGVPVPDASQVKLSPWLRAQVRLAPIERLLAAREAAENTEVAGRYGQPTGDTQTDRLLGELRQDEHGHARQLATMRQSGSAGTASLVESKLQHILGRETWHQTGTGWISGAIYGANDGLAAVFGIVSGVAGATGGSSFVLTAGLAGALASALSMATGAFLAERSQGEVTAANLAQERQEIEERPEEEKEELSLYYQLKGLDQQEADVLAEKLSQNPDAFLHLLAAEELGGAKAESGNPAQAALAAGVSTGIGALIPVLPFFWLHGALAVLLAAAISLVAHFLVGAAKSLFTLRSWWAAGLEMTLAGVIVGGVTFAAGLLFHA